MSVFVMGFIGLGRNTRGLPLRTHIHPANLTTFGAVHIRSATIGPHPRNPYGVDFAIAVGRLRVSAPNIRRAFEFPNRVFTEP